MKTITKTLLALSVLGALPACQPHDKEESTTNASTTLGSTPTSWSDAPVILSAWQNYVTGGQHAGEQTTAAPVSFSVPEAIYVQTGNAGNGQVQFQFKTGTSVATCTYQGGSAVAHPTTDLDRMHGRRYLMTGCDGGQQAGNTVTSNWFLLRMLGGDPQDPAGMTSASLQLGGGCSDQLPAPLAADEVVDMRDGFTWDTVPKLSETDPDGNAALYHGLVYIESKDQLAALDRLRVYWSAQPISERYMAGLRGRCGRVEHATDGRGVVVYALFPARLFNVLRDFSIQAIHANIAPPFRFIIPSPPDQPEYVNTDGSIKYSALGSSGFADWLTTRASQQPSWYDPTSWPGDISDAAGDSWDWTKNNIIDPTEKYGEYGFDYALNGFDAAIDWSSNFLDDTWEGIQQGLQKFVLLFSDKVTLNLKITMENRDPQLPANTPLARLWGPADATGNRPNIVPAGAHVRVRQWGWGFLPVMNQNQLAEDGTVSLTAVKGDSGRGGDLCVEMDTDYGMITTDFIPNEVCDFAQGRYGSYEQSFDYRSDPAANLLISQPDLYDLTQIKDSADYFKTVEGAGGYTFDVLTGWVANEMTQIIAGQHRAMTLCLDFPGTGAAAITTAATGIGAVVVGPITAGLALFGASLIEKDLWLPDADDEAQGRDSRGMITHEYGHFTMCSLLFAQDGPPGLTGLIERVFEGQNDSRSDEVALMTESWADTFAMQVVGGANYIHSPSASQGVMGFCTKSPCMDQNYIGNNDYLQQASTDPNEFPFYDELARFESLMYDAFDRSDSTQRFANAPANGDIFQSTAAGLVVSPTPYIANSDENVSLPGSAWANWVTHWLDRGRVPSKVNVIGGLVDTMADQGYSWCDRCDLLALHDKTTDPSAYDADPTGHGAPTTAQRYSRWLSCTKSPDITTWLGAPPASNLSMDASCTPCPVHNFVNASGVCEPCPTGSIAWGNQCSPCEYGAAAGAEFCIVG